MRSANRLCAHVVHITSIPTWGVGDGDGVGGGGGSEVKKNNWYSQTHYTHYTKCILDTLYIRETTAHM